MRTLAVYPLNVRSPFRRSKIVYNRAGGGEKEEGGVEVGAKREIIQPACFASAKVSTPTRSRSFASLKRGRGEGRRKGKGGGGRGGFRGAN